MTSKQELLQLFEADSEKHIAFLQSLVRLPTPNPPGETTAAIAAVRAHLEEAGISSHIIEPKKGSPNLVSILRADQDGLGDARARKRNIVLNGHIDQFPVDGASQWLRQPYSGDVDAGFVHGRSGVDMKAGTAASIIAFIYLWRCREHLSGRCTLQIVSDEETGGRWGTRYLLEDDAHDSWRGDCVLIGEPSGLDSIRFGEKGTLRLTFNISTQAGHGAYVHRNEGAIRIASRLIQSLIELEKLELEMDFGIKRHMEKPEVRRVADEIMWPGAADAMAKVTVNIGTIQGGAKINMIPAECSFQADLRIPIGVATSAVRDRIDRMLEHRFPSASYEVHENHSNLSTHCEPDHELVDLLQQNAMLVRGVKPVPISSLGATDCKHFRRHGIPAYAYGPHPRGMGERDEKVSIQEFLETVKVHTLTAWEYLSKQQ